MADRVIGLGRSDFSLGKEKMMKYFDESACATPEQLRAYVEACDNDLEDRMESIAADIADDEKIHLLGLTGPTCAGKTTAARKLTSYLSAHGHRVHVISIDDFFHDQIFAKDDAVIDENKKLDYDSEKTIDMELLSEKCEDLLAGRPTDLPRFDFQTGLRVNGNRIEPQAGDVFLFEGIQILYPAVNEILQSSHYRSIYICPHTSLQVGDIVFTPNRLRLMRRLVRDYRYRATDPDFTFYLWESVRENEEKNIFPYAHLCNDRIDSTMPYEVGMLKPYLCDILQQIPPDSSFFEKAQRILRDVEHVPPVPAEYMTKHSLYKEFI